jgi:hypothetical protein
MTIFFLDFVRRNRKEWYKVVPSDKAINSGVGARLRSCHTATKNKGKKSSHRPTKKLIEDSASEDDIDNSKDGVDDIEDNISVRSFDFDNQVSSSQDAEKTTTISSLCSPLSFIIFHSFWSDCPLDLFIIPVSAFY